MAVGLAYAQKLTSPHCQHNPYKVPSKVRIIRHMVVLLAVITLSASPKLERRSDGLWYDKANNKPFTGRIFAAYPTSEKKSETNYLSGRQHGLTIHWYRNGKRQSQFQYAGGKLNGMGAYWYEDGQLQYQASYQQGVLHGRADDWWPNGKPGSEEHYLAGRKHGLWKSWWPDGKRAEEKLWQNGALMRTTKWDKDGNLRLPDLSQTENDLALLTPKPMTVAKRVPWTIGDGRNAIDKIYPGKPVKTIRTVFGKPDQSTPEAWIYNDLKITNPKTKRKFSRVRFEFKNGRVNRVSVFSN